MDERILELLEKKNYTVLKPLLEEMNAADLASVLADFPEEYLAVVYRLLPKELAADTFVELDSELQELLIHAFSDKELKVVLDELFLDDTVDIIEEMPANVVRRIMAQSDTETRKQINELLKYPEDSAGALMTKEYVRFRGDVTVEQAFAIIRRVGIDKETIYTCYVTDESTHLIGIVSVKDLLLNDYDKTIAEIMETNIISTGTLTDKEDVANAFAKYDFVAMPVVDQENRIVGIITIDDAIDVLQEEITEDFEKMAAIVPSDKPYLKENVMRIALHRLPWLLILMISATFTGMIIEANEAILNMPIFGIILTACMPMLMGTGGNGGAQASVTITRGIALNEIEMKDIFKVMWKEARIGLLLGAILSVACFGKLMLFNQLYAVEGGMTLALVICLSMFVTLIVSKLIGCVLPLLAKKCHLDPAVVASPFITTIIDILSMVLYCGIALALLN